MTADPIARLASVNPVDPGASPSAADMIGAEAALVRILAEKPTYIRRRWRGRRLGLLMPAAAAIAAAFVGSVAVPGTAPQAQAATQALEDAAVASRELPSGPTSTYQLISTRTDQRRDGVAYVLAEQLDATSDGESIDVLVANTAVEFASSDDELRWILQGEPPLATRSSLVSTLAAGSDEVLAVQEAVVFGAEPPAVEPLVELLAIPGTSSDLRASAYELLADMPGLVVEHTEGDVTAIAHPDSRIKFTINTQSGDLLSAVGLDNGTVSVEIDASATAPCVAVTLSAPRALDGRCGGAFVGTVRHLRWTGWGSSTATGSGRLHGKVVTVTLADLEDCGRGAAQYATLTVRGPLRSTSATSACRAAD